MMISFKIYFENGVTGLVFAKSCEIANQMAQGLAYRMGTEVKQ